MTDVSATDEREAIESKEIHDAVAAQEDGPYGSVVNVSGYESASPATMRYVVGYLWGELKKARASSIPV